jgi:gamma-glutamyltranspeptidase/glutathione hydrolase
LLDAPAKGTATRSASHDTHNLVRRPDGFKRRFGDRIGRRGAVAAALAATMALSACAAPDDVLYGDVGYVTGFFGGIAADEPTAVLVGRDILTSGGSAADAAVAMSFAMSVTYPSAISLGGGGACIVHDSALGLTEVIDFVPPAGTGAGGDRPSAVPTLTRGMAALHARYGRFSWASLVSPAERFARLGHRVSRALASELARAATPLYNEPSATAVFAPEGRLLGEGQILEQADLASILGQIRANGAGAFYTGQLARRIVAGVQEAGGSLTFEELTAYRPTWKAPLIVPYGDGDEAHFTPPPAVGGTMAAIAFRMLAEDDRYASADPAERPHMLAEVMKRAAADRKDWLAQGFTTATPLEQVTDPDRVRGLMAGYDPNRATPGAQLDPRGRQLIEVIAGTGFVAVDQTGMAVSCTLSLYNPFGTGRVAGDTGMLLAAAPGLRGRNPLGLGPVMAINGNNLRFKFALAAGGGPLAQATTARILADTLLARVPLDEAIAAPRQLAVDVPDTVLVEEEGGDELAAALAAKGHPVSRLGWTGTASAVHCPLGLDSDSNEALCRVVNDPRGFGLSTFSEGGS